MTDFIKGEPIYVLGVKATAEGPLKAVVMAGEYNGDMTIKLKDGTIETVDAESIYKSVHDAQEHIELAAKTPPRFDLERIKKSERMKMAFAIACHESYEDPVPFPMWKGKIDIDPSYYDFMELITEVKHCTIFRTKEKECYLVAMVGTIKGGLEFSLFSKFEVIPTPIHLRLKVAKLTKGKRDSDFTGVGQGKITIHPPGTYILGSDEEYESMKEHVLEHTGADKFEFIDIYS